MEPFVIQFWLMAGGGIYALWYANKWMRGTVSGRERTVFIYVLSLAIGLLFFS